MPACADGEKGNNMDVYEQVGYNRRTNKTRPPGATNSERPLTTHLGEQEGSLMRKVSHTHSPRQAITYNGTEYEIDPDTGGVLIPLHGKKYAGRFAVVDVEDIHIVACHKWYGLEPSSQNPGRTQIYAKCFKGGERRTFPLMHRLILGVTERGVCVDHINHNGLDNRRENIRLVTNQQNIQRMRPRIGVSSLFRGVYRDGDVWQACIGIEGRTLHLGRFICEKEAARAYDAMASKHYGRFAYLNFPED